MSPGESQVTARDRPADPATGLLDLPVCAVRHPRCPFCHEPVEPADVPAPCLACRAWHHAACLDEARQRCAACGVHGASAPAAVLVRERTAVQVVPSRREQVWSAGLWILGLGVMYGINASVLPAFAKMFKEVGVCLPIATELALDGGWVWSLAILTLLHAAALVTERGTRARLRLAAFAICVLGVILGIVALFLPLCQLSQPL
jgi:hypothetical protein